MLGDRGGAECLWEGKGELRAGSGDSPERVARELLGSAPCGEGLRSRHGHGAPRFWPCKTLPLPCCLAAAQWRWHIALRRLREVTSAINAAWPTAEVSVACSCAGGMMARRRCS